MNKETSAEAAGRKLRQFEFIQASTPSELVDAIAKSKMVRGMIGNVEVLGRGLDILAFAGLKMERDNMGQVVLTVAGANRLYASSVTQIIGRLLGKRFKLDSATTAGIFDLQIRLVDDAQSLGKAI